MGLRNTFFQLTLLSVCAVLAFNAHAQDDPQNQPVDLPRGIVKKFDNEVIPAIQRGDNDLFTILMMHIVERSDKQQLELIEDYCKSKGIESIHEQFADAVLDQIAQGAAPDTLKFMPSIYVSNKLVDRANQLIEKIDLHSFMGKPDPPLDDWSVSEEMFSDIQTFKDQLEEAQNASLIAIALLTPHLRKIRASEDPDNISTAQQVTKMDGDLATKYLDVANREGELRLLRFQAASKTLTGQGDFETKLKAAMTLEMDAETLIFLLKNAPEDLLRAPLNDANLLNQIVSTRRAARKAGGEISQKAILLQRGLEQWTRGRYGIGPMAAGLLKSPEATTSEAAMQDLYMPRSKLNPINEYYEGEGYTPGYNRRHYYTWAVEYREWKSSFRQESLERLASWDKALRSPPVRTVNRMVRGSGAASLAYYVSPFGRKKVRRSPAPRCPMVSERIVTGKETIRTTIRAGFTEADGSIPYRLVGSYEYMGAIESLESLIRISTPEEIKVYNKIVGEQTQFTLFSGVVTKFGLNPSGGLKGKQIVEFDKSFKKQSLQWLLALARVEVGATMSMYGSFKTPFIEIAPNGFGAEEYWSLLIDDLNAHIEGMSKDSNLVTVVKQSTSPNSETLAYLRRFKLVNDMLKSIEVGGPEYAYRSKKLQNELDNYREKLVMKILRHSINVRRVDVQTRSMVVNRCAEMATQLNEEQESHNR